MARHRERQLLDQSEMEVQFWSCAGHVLPGQKGARPTLSESAWAVGKNRSG